MNWSIFTKIGVFATLFILVVGTKTFAQHNFENEPMVFGPPDTPERERGAGNNLGESKRTPANTASVTPAETYEQLLNRQRKQYVRMRFEKITTEEWIFRFANGTDALIALFEHDFALEIIEREARNREIAEKEAKAKAAKAKAERENRESNREGGMGGNRY